MSKKISELTTATDVTVNDFFQVVDFEDPTMASSGTNKKISARTLGNNLPVTATGSSASRTLKDRFADILDAKDFGAEGTGEIVLNVPSQYATIRAAFTYLSTKRIATGTTVKIQVADGTHTFTQAVYINHPDGSNIEILGNQTTPANCVLNFSTSDGFYLAQGSNLKKLNGFRIVNTTTQTNATARLGILTDGGSFLKVGPAIEVHNFYYGISARNGGFIDAAGSSTQYVKVTDSGDCGIWAFLNSHVNCEWAKVSGSDDSANGLGGGIVAEFSSSILATGCEVSYNWLCGFSSLSNSSIRAWDANSHHNMQGLIAGSGGNIEFFGNLSEIKNNSQYGIYSVDGMGFVYGAPPSPRLGLNTLGDFYNIFDFKSDKGTAINSGSLSIDATQPANITGSDAYVDLNCPVDKVNVVRFLENSIEKARLQYDSTNDILSASGGGKNGFRFFTETGKTTIGSGAPSTTQTTGVGIQIPAVNGVPTGVISDVQSGYAPLVYDTQSNKLYVWNAAGTPAWKSVTLT